MKNRHCVPWLALFLAAVFSAPTYGGQLSLGFLSFDPGTGNTGVFDIVNMTGPNDTTFPDTSFPVATPVTFFDLLLTVDFVGGGSTTLNSSDFVSDGSGGFTGLSQFDLTAFPIADAILSGSISPSNLVLNDGTTGVHGYGGLSATILPSSGPSLQVGDFAIIDAVPEPASWVLLGTGLLGALLVRGRRGKAARRTLLVAGCCAVALPSSWAQVKLNTAAQPAAGNAGVTVEKLTGSGFPAGTITPAGVTISLAATCNGAAAATTAASLVTTIAGSTRRVSFTIPGNAPAGTYAVSVSGSGFSTVSCSSLTVEAADRFVHVSSGQLMFNGYPFRFGGGNSYGLMFESQATVDQVLATASGSAMKVIRMWAFDDIGVPGPNNNFYLQYWSGSAPAYNDGANGLANVDYAVYRAGQLGLKLIIPFTNNWPDYGGMDQYVKWNNQSYHDQFYSDPVIRQWYKNWISHLLNHVNTYNGIAYRNDPAIAIWELANEPRCAGTGLPTSGGCTPQTIVSWITDVASYIKSIDTDHLVAVGDEGFYCIPGKPASDFIENCSSGVDTLAFSEVPGIDLMGFHLYPEGWGQSIAWSETFTNQHLSDASQRVNKPAYLGEFGLLSGNTRNFVYQDWTNRVLNEGGAGALFWDLMPGTPSPSASESSTNFDLEAGAPTLITIDNFEQMMAANTVLPLAPVAGDQWATTPFNQPATLNPLQNDVAYAGATINPSSLDLDPSAPGQQTFISVYGGMFSLAGQQVQFTPTAGFNGATQASYTVQDSNGKLSNPAYLFVTVNPSQNGALILESFETGTDGWGPISPSAGTVVQSSNFHTDGNFGLQVNATGGGWFGVTFPSSIDLSGRPSVSIDIQTTGLGGGTAIAFQSGSAWTWCQTPDPWPTLATNTVTTLTLQLDPAQLNCGGGTPNLTNIHTLFVYLNGPGTFYLDDLRAAPPTNPNAPIVIESFETGTDGWHSVNGFSATIAQTNAFHTDGNNGLSITPASGVADWFGFNLSSPVNITGKSTIKVDMETQAAGTSTAIAIQTGAGYTWCQTANWGFQGSSSTGTVTLNLATDCPSADLTSLRAVWVWIGGGGTFYLDFVRAQ
jgi:mannan endo-1,4-beta-mannosidase